MIKTGLLVSLLTSFMMGSFAHSYEDSSLAMKKAVIAKFLKEANDKKSEIGKSITKINEETADGRNQDGTIGLPVKASDLQVVKLSGQEILVPWHYASKTDGYCESTVDSAQFMILLTKNQMIHYAEDMETLAFVVDAEQFLKVKVITKDYVDCEEIVEFGNDRKVFGKVESGYTTSKFKLVKLPAIDTSK